ncbi:RagB/SusD family nutrient uptake outer membrane protein [Parapedobacter soli]|uniref:RagB/SusD family nutrient uptake outer membrane protein n=1 Tax=Parapedobacter soli TaxID=416955 RepID=UPI0021C76C78|nr:RagB/SusD family nutrient uptake outer membrane protein [Parapedobacter soli]
MRRYFFFILLVFLLGTIMESCTDVLDTKPYSFTSVDKFYNTAQDAELALTGCYSLLNTIAVQGTAGGPTFRSTLLHALYTGNDENVTRDGYTDVNLSQYGLLSVTSQMQSLNNMWFALFAGINRTNYLINNIDNVPMDPVRRAEVKGEALFLRALYYMYTAKLFGGVPVYTHYLQDETAQRQPLKEVYDQIIADYREAYQLLPHRAGMAARANKWSAGGMLAKVYTYLASAKKYGTGQQLSQALNKFDWVDVNATYAQAKIVIDDIIANSGYKLTANYDYLFRETTQAWQFEECMFVIESSTSPVDGNYNLWINFLVPTGPQTTGAGSGTSRPLGEMYYRYDARDPRRSHNLSATMPAGSAKETIEGVPYYKPNALANPNTGVYCIAKFRMRDPVGKATAASVSTGNTPLLRYADILLLSAEVEQHVGNEQGARDRLREVRKRVITDEVLLDQLTTVYKRDVFLDELLEERSRELCFEGWRRIDLIRFNKFETELMKLTNNRGFYNSNVPAIQANWKPYKIWLPIPRNEIEISPIEQNEGYE